MGRAGAGPTGRAVPRLPPVDGKSGEEPGTIGPDADRPGRFTDNSKLTRHPGIDKRASGHFVDPEEAFQGLPTVTPGQSSVRNGVAGSPAEL